MRLFEMNYSLYRIIPQAGRLEYFAAPLPTTMLRALLHAGGRSRVPRSVSTLIAQQNRKDVRRTDSLDPPWPQINSLI